MTRGVRVRPLVLSSVPAWIPVLLALTIPGDISAQSYPDAAPSTWTTSDDRDRMSIDWSDDVPAHIAIVEGTAWLERDNIVEAGSENVPLPVGDRLRTERGRLEVLFADGTVLDLDERTTVELLSDSLMRMQRGRVRLSIARASSSTDYRVDAAGTSAVLRTPGEYRVTVDDTTRTTPRVAVTVIHGAAELSSRYGHAQVRAGFEAWATATSDPTPPYVASVAFWDAFDAGAMSSIRTTRRPSLRGTSRRESPVRRPVRPLRLMAVRRLVRLRLVSACRHNVASVLSGPLVVRGCVRVGLGRRRSLVMADSSLRTLGHERESVVLDSRSSLGTSVGWHGRKPLVTWAGRRWGSTTARSSPSTLGTRPHGAHGPPCRLVTTRTRSSWTGEAARHRFRTRASWSVAAPRGAPPR